MFLKLVLIILVGTCSAKTHLEDEENPKNYLDDNLVWEPNQRYVYNVTTKTMTALADIEDRWTGVVTNAELVISVKPDGYVVGRVERAVYAQFNQPLPQGYRTLLDSLPLSWKPMALSSKPFGIAFKKGTIKGLFVQTDVPNHQVNMLKGIVGQLQVDLRGTNLIKSNYDRVPSNETLNGVYKTMEKSVSGECETGYSVKVLPKYSVQSRPELVPLPQLIEEDNHIINVNKHKNFSNCERRMGYHFGITGASNMKPNTNQMGNILTKESTSNIILVGKLYNYTIQSVQTVNKVFVSPTLVSTQKAMTYAAVNVTLKRVERLDKEPLGPSEDNVAFVGLVYSYNLPEDKSNHVRPEQEVSSSSSSSSSDSSSESSSSSSSESSDSSAEEKDNLKISPAEQYYEQVKQAEKANKRSRRDLNAQKEKKYFEAYKMDQNRLSRWNDTSSDSSSSDESSSSSSMSSEEGRNNGDTSSSSSSHSSSSSSSSSSSESQSSSEEFFQPAPKDMKKAPSVPLLPYATGYKGSSIQNARNVDASRLVPKMAKNIAQSLQNPSSIPKQNTLDSFNNLVNIVRMMDHQELFDATQQLFVSEKERKEGDSHSVKFAERVDAWNVHRAALKIAGTPPAFRVIKEYVQEEKMRGLEAVVVVAALPKNIKYPTENLMEEFFELATSSAVKKQHVLNATALLAVTDFLYRAQVDKQSASNYYPVNSFGHMADFHSKLVTHKVIPYLSHELRMSYEAADNERFLVVARALGNLGHEEIVNVFLPYLEGRLPVTDFQRFAIVMSLDRLAENVPNLARNVLLNLYENKGDTNEVRSAAVLLLMRTNPPVDLLQRMAQQTEQDSTQVSALVKSAIESLAEYEQDNSNSEATRDAKSAVKFLTPDQFGLQFSRAKFIKYAVEGLELSYNIEAAQFASKNSPLPAGLLLYLRKNLGGLEQQSSFHYILSNMEAIVDLLDDKVVTVEEQKNEERVHLRQTDANQKQEKVHKKEDPKAEQQWSTDRIAKMLKIDPEDVKQIGGQMWFELLNGQHMATFDNRTIEQLPRMVRKLAKNLEEGVKLNFTELYQTHSIVVASVLETGFPFTFTLNVPTLIKLEVEASGKTVPNVARQPAGHPENDNDDHVYVPHYANITADVNVVFSRLLDAKVGFNTPFDHQRYIAGVQRKQHFNVPISIDANLNFWDDEYQVNLKPLKPKEDVLVAHISTWPYTAYKDITDVRPVAENANAQVLHDTEDADDETKTFERTFGENTTGVVFHLQVKDDKPGLDLGNIMELVQQHKYGSALLYPFTSPALHYNQANLHYDAARTIVGLVTFSFKGDSLSDGEQDYEESDIKHPKSRHGVEGFYNEMNLAQPVTFSPNSQRRQKQLMKNAAAGIRNSEINLWDVGVEFKAHQQKAEFILTLATAGSKVDERSRLVMFASASPFVAGPSSKQQQLCLTLSHRSPNVPMLNFLNALNHDVTSDVNVNLAFGEKCQGGAQVIINGKLQQTDRFRDSLRYSELGQQCKEQMDRGYFQLPECQNVTHQASNLDLFTFDIEYSKLPAAARGVTNKLLNYAKTLVFPRFEENAVSYKGKEGRAQLKVELAPLSADRANITLVTPSRKLQITEVPVENELLRALLLVHAAQDWDERLLTAVYAGEKEPSCAISPKYVNTFDGTTYHYETGNCWHVAMHTVKPEREYSSPQSHFYQTDEEQYVSNGFEQEEQISVLVRSDEESQQHVKIVLGQQNNWDYNVDIMANGAELPQIFVNNEPLQVHKKYTIPMYTEDGGDQPLLRVHALPGKELLVDVRDGQLVVVTDGYRVRLFVDRDLHDDTVGLCGTNNKEDDDDFTTPQQCVMDIPEHFAASWAITGQNCSGPAKALAIAAEQRQKEQCFKVENNFGTVISEADASRKRYRFYNHNIDSSSSSESSSSSSESSESTSSSSSSSSESLEDKALEQKVSKRKCQLHNRCHFVEDKGRLCFTKRPLPTCDVGCRTVTKEDVYVNVYCHPLNDAYTDHLRGVCLQGHALVLDGKPTTKTLKFPRASKCESPY